MNMGIMCLVCGWEGVGGEEVRLRGLWEHKYCVSCDVWVCKGERRGGIGR